MGQREREIEEEGKGEREREGERGSKGGGRDGGRERDRQTETEPDNRYRENQQKTLSYHPLPPRFTHSFCTGSCFKSMPKCSIDPSASLVLGATTIHKITVCVVQACLPVLYRKLCSSICVLQARSHVLYRKLWGGSKGVINFSWIFYAMWSLVPVGNFRNISEHLFIGLFAGIFSDAMGYCLPIVSCEMTRTK